MSLAPNSSQYGKVSLKPDRERRLVASFVEQVRSDGVQAETADLVNLYVSLKSKPLAVLVGPSQQGKLALARSFAQTFVGESPQFQIMSGHAYWASGSDQVSLYTEAQAHNNGEKILKLVDEANLARNSRRLYIACLSKISPAELETFFSTREIQTGKNPGLYFPCAHPAGTAPLPDNLLMIGTMDTDSFKWWNPELFNHTNLILWPEAEIHPGETKIQPDTKPREQAEFLKDSIRTIRPARFKLGRILGYGFKGLEPVHRIRVVLESHQVRLRDDFTDGILIYLANAWSRDDIGLFDTCNENNVRIALDLAILQQALHLVLAQAQWTDDLRADLIAAFGEDCPRSSAFLRSLTISEKEQPTTTNLDPVCGMEVQPQTAAAAQRYGRETYYFCANCCHKAFLKQPRKYIREGIVLNFQT